MAKEVEKDIVTIRSRLLELREEKYADFQAKLVPNIPPATVLGVRVPELRKLAREYRNSPEMNEFMQMLPHEYYDENMLHVLLIEQIKDFDMCLQKIELFLPYVDNWAVCDIMRPKAMLKNRPLFHKKCMEWLWSEHIYTCRFGMECLMNFFLDEDDFQADMQQVSYVRSDEYYVNMMIAWYFATALAIHWDEAVDFLERQQLSVWVHNKTIQKAVESFRITKEQKDYLKGLKRKAQ